MIRSFRHRGLRRLYESDDERRIDPRLVAKVRDILSMLDSAENVGDLDLPTFRLHRLQGDLDGRWAVTVRANWRIVFRFENGEATDVDLTDYH